MLSSGWSPLSRGDWALVEGLVSMNCTYIPTILSMYHFGENAENAIRATPQFAVKMIQDWARTLELEPMDLLKCLGDYHWILGCNCQVINVNHNVLLDITICSHPDIRLSYGRKPIDHGSLQIAHANEDQMFVDHIMLCGSQRCDLQTLGWQ